MCIRDSSWSVPVPMVPGEGAATRRTVTNQQRDGCWTPYHNLPRWTFRGCAGTQCTNERDEIAAANYPPVLEPVTARLHGTAPLCQDVIARATVCTSAPNRWLTAGIGPV